MNLCCTSLEIMAEELFPGIRLNMPSGHLPIKIGECHQTGAIPVCQQFSAGPETFVSDQPRTATSGFTTHHLDRAVAAMSRPPHAHRRLLVRQISAALVFPADRADCLPFQTNSLHPGGAGC